MTIFLDTNILVYAAAGRKNEPRKADVALSLMADGTAVISAQVLAEFYNTVIKKQYLSESQANFWMERLILIPAVDVDAPLVLEGIALSQRYRIKYWDGAIIAAGHRSQADTIYSEDMNHNQVYGSVRVINPFLEA